jgi:hypothetical protein
MQVGREYAAQSGTERRSLSTNAMALSSRSAPPSAQVDDDGRREHAAVARCPFDSTGVHVERGQRLVVARVDDDQTLVAEGRHRGIVERMLRWRLLLPRECPGSRIEGGQDAADAERVELVAVEQRRRLRACSMSGCGTARLIRRRILRLPELPPAVDVEGRKHLVVAAAAEAVDDVADDDGRRVALADICPPSARQVLGPCVRLEEGTGLAIPVPSAPLRIVPGRALGDGGRGRPDQHRGRHRQPGLVQAGQEPFLVAGYSRHRRAPSPACIVSRTTRWSVGVDHTYDQPGKRSHLAEQRFRLIRGRCGHARLTRTR